jgi:GrpB-like predicted nucleotidyltransferase (UPF0157 family)
MTLQQNLHVKQTGNVENLHEIVPNDSKWSKHVHKRARIWVDLLDRELY